MRLERLDDTINKVDKLMERWENRFASKSPASMAEGYLNGDYMALARLQLIGIHCREYFVIFKALPANATQINPFVARRLYSKKMGNRQQIAMLVVNVEIVEGPQGVIPSAIWLEPANDLDDIWSGPVYVSFTDGTLKVGPAISKRETDTLCAAFIESNEVTSKEIEGCTEIVDHIPDDYGKILRYLGVDFGSKVYAPSKTPISMRNNGSDNCDTIRLRCHESLEAGIKLREMAFGPVNL